LFLDEVGALPLALQSRLLRFLQSGMVGRTLVDVRLICSAAAPCCRHWPPANFVRISITAWRSSPRIAPLRNRGGDIEALAQSFLRRFAREQGKKFNALGPDHIAALEAYSWPGNLHELQNVIRRAALLFDGPELPLRALPAVPPTPVGQTPQAVEPGTEAPAFTATDHEMLYKALAGLTLDQIEKLAIEGAIQAAHGSLPGAARILGSALDSLSQARTLERGPAFGLISAGLTSPRHYRPMNPGTVVGNAKVIAAHVLIGVARTPTGIFIAHGAARFILVIAKHAVDDFLTRGKTRTGRRACGQTAKDRRTHAAALLRRIAAVTLTTKTGTTETGATLRAIAHRAGIGVIPPPMDAL
jgi:hypothetical protein